TILKYGVPMHSDGVNQTMEYANIYDGLFVYRTWFPYYIQAFSLWLLGNATFAARLPFALGGVLSVWFLYFLALKLTAKKSVAFLSALFLASSIPALLYFRTARYVGLPILFNILLIFFYLGIFEKKKWNPVPLIITAILYFHTMYVEFAGSIIGIFLHFLIYRKTIAAENINKVLPCAAAVATFTVPWAIYISPVFDKVYETYHSASDLIDTSFVGYFKHIGAFLFQLNNHIFPVSALFFLFVKPLKPYRFQIQLLVISTIATVLTGSLNSIPLQQYLAACFPLLYILLALVIMEAVRGWVSFKVGIAALLITTNLIHVGPFLPLKPLLRPPPDIIKKSSYLHGVYNTVMWQVALRSSYYDYWHEITHPYKGPLDTVVAFFQNHGAPGHTAFIDNEGDAFIFYSQMKLIRKLELSADDKPDWIILRGGQISLEERRGGASPMSQKLKTIIQSNPYKKIILKGPVDRINNSYYIQIHRFKTRPATKKAIIYQLQKTS
ncbi:MAG: ArnT family glycosyltransferase, partial [Nitrospinales bacterium]